MVDGTTRDQIREQAGAVGEDLRKLGGMVRDAAKDMAARHLEQTGKTYGEIEERVTGYIREKPVQSVLIAAGAGVVLGWLVSSLSRR
jgi:ElaB/YqjD/DUF883 family membrane-anchored ribosome-binding protein